MEHDRGTVGVGERLPENSVNPTLETAARPRRTVRQQESWPNSEKTAERSNKEIASLWQHSQPTGGRTGFPIGSASAFASASVLQSRTIPVRPPDGRRSTETASTAIENGKIEFPTGKKRRREPATAFELPRLIKPQPLRCRKPEQRTAIRAFYVQLAAYIFSSRYTTASQVLRRFPELLRTERTAQRHLQNMSNHGLIAVASTRGTSPNFPFAFFCTRKGISFIRKNIANGDKLQIPMTEERRTRGQSLHSLMHELMLTEFSLLLTQTTEKRGDIDLLSQERRYFRSDRQLKFREDGEVRRVEPDFGFLPVLVQPNGNRDAWPMHFVELELGSHRAAALRDKLLAYDRWAKSEADSYLTAINRRHGFLKVPTFRLLIIACDAYRGQGDDQRLLDLLTQSVLLPSRTRDRIWLCRASDLNIHTHDEMPLAAPIWIRAKDAKQWLSERRTRRIERQGSVSYVQTRKHLESKFETMRRHVLLPYQN